MTLPKYIISAALLALLGLGAAAMALNYRLGSLHDMGPGMFPMVLGIGMAVLAVLYLVLARRGGQETEEKVTFNDGRPLVVILASVVAFGVLLDPLGLVVALSVLITGCWIANTDRKLIELPMMLVLYNAMAIVIFVHFLNIPIRLGPL